MAGRCRGPWSRSLSLRGAAEDRIGRTTADAEGRYAVELPALARMSPAERAVARIMGHGLAPGHWQESGLLAGTLERRPPGDLRLDLRMTPGTRLTGRVVDRDGKPVPLSAVRLLPEGAPELPPETVTDDEGRYVLGIPRAGRYRVVAALPQAGSGFLDAFDAGPGPDVAAPDLVLRGDGVIEGVVRRPDGAPLGDAMVVALPEWGWRPARRSEWLLPGLRMEEHAHPGTGLTDGEAWTDATGAFRITGVRPGRYCLLALDVDDLHDPPLRVHATGTVASVVVETPRLRVRVRDEGGRALPGAHLFRKGPRGGLDEDVRPASGCVDLSVRAGESWRLVVMVPAFPPVEASFTVPSRGLDHEVELVVRESAPRGSVRVRLQDRAGRAIRRFRTHFHLADGELLMATDSDVESGEDLLEGIPVGRYRLVVHPGRPGRDRWLPVGQDDVEVAAERETAVRLRAERTGGRVRLRVRPPEGATAGQQYSLHVAAVRPGLPVPDKHDLVRRETPSATWLKSYRTAPKGEPEEDPDRASVSTILLEPGPYDLTVRAEGFQRFVRPIVIVEGETVEVEVRLTP
jgi:hypothetical protein